MSHRLTLPLDQLVPNNYREEGDISELQASISKRGIKSPLLVLPRSDGRYDIFAGHRRYKVAKNLDLKEVPVYILDNADTHEDRLLDQLVENNLHEKDGVTLALKLKELKDFGVRNSVIAEAMGKAESWASTLIGLVLTDNAPYMAFITGKDLYFEKRGYDFFLSIDDIYAAGKNPDDFDVLEGTGSEISSIYYCAELVQIYKKVLNHEIQEHVYTFNKYIAGLIATKRNNPEGIQLACRRMLQKIGETKAGPEGETTLPELDLDKVTESLVRIFSKGKIEDPKELQKLCRIRFKQAGIPVRIYIEEWDNNKPEKGAEIGKSSIV